jgi:hypothetical protein
MATVPKQTIAVRKLDGTNYSMWSREMTNLLIILELDDAIAAEGWGETYTAANAKKDRKAKAYFQGNMTDNVFKLIIDCETTKALWEKLKKMYASKGITRGVLLKRKLTNMSLGGMSISEYVSTAKETAGELLEAGYEVDDEEVIMHILAGLPGSYDTVVEILENSTKQLKLEDIEARLMNYEERMNGRRGGSSNSMALAAMGFSRGGYGKQGKGKRCFECGDTRHERAQCPKFLAKKEQANTANDLFCIYCKKTGHTFEKCMQYQRDKEGQQRLNTHEAKKGKAFSALHASFPDIAL